MFTEEVYQAFLRCETKSYLKLTGAVGPQREFSDWQRRRVEEFEEKCRVQLRSRFREDECVSGASLAQVLENSKCRFAIDGAVQAQEVQSRIPALERIASPGKKDSPFIPV